MAGTILGKRNRASESSTVSASFISSRVKRRAYVPIYDDGDALPIFPQPGRNGDAQDARMDLDDLENAPQAQYQVSKRIFANAASWTPTQSAALSPRKANGQARGSAEAHKDGDNDENVPHLQLPTPKTPRRRDALFKKVPITPRHRIGLVGKPVTPRFTRTPSIPGNVPTVYNGARQLFTRSMDPGRLVGRVKERNELHDLIQKGVHSNSGRCLYVSGPPGTGKSALVGEVCKEVEEEDGVKIAYINCMSVKSSGELYRKLVDELLGDEQLLENEDLEELRAIFLPRRKAAGPMYVVTLDEIDHLLSLDLEVLYTLFEWSLQRSSRLILIGIANALDLTDRFLPRLKARNLKPQLLPFLPYTADQIAEVITTKLHSLLTEDAKEPANFVPFVHPAAIQLCSKKVASQTGDLRKAFDIIRRTIDLVESETKQKLQRESNIQDLETSPSKTPLTKNPNLSSPIHHKNSSLTALTPFTAPRATIAHVSCVSAASLSNGTIQRLATLNLQQKAALCALISLQKASHRGVSSIFTTPSKTANAPPPTVRKLHETYCALCKRENALHPLTATEFADVISGLETLGLVGEERKGSMFGVKAGTPSRKGKCIGGVVGEDRRVVCFVDEKEVEGCLDGVGGWLLQGLLSGDT